MCLCVSNQRQRRLSWRKVMGYELGSRAEHSVLCQLTQRHIAHIGVHQTIYPYVPMCFQSAAASPVMEESNGLRAREQSRTQCALSINTKAHSTHRRALSMRRLQNYVTSVPMCFQLAAAASSILFNPFNQKPLNYVPMCFPKSNETPHATPPKTPATPSQSTGCGASRDAAIPARSASHPASCPG